MAAAGQRCLFVTGRLAEPALRRVIADLAPRAGLDAEVAVLPISVAALLTIDWVRTHLRVPPQIDRIILPGYCRGAAADLTATCGVQAELGPHDLRDLPEHFGKQTGPPADYGDFDIEILAEINHAPSMSRPDLLALARRYRTDGADVIDLGCDPGSTWADVGDAVRALREEGFRVSIDSMNAGEVAAAVRAGAELVLSVNSTNCRVASDWGAEVVAIPDEPGSLAGLDGTIQELVHRGVPFRIDPILEPIGFGFAASLGRCFEVRRRYPEADMFLGVGNLTELTDVDSAGINVLLAGFCQELGIHSVLTTEVIPWCRSCVRELDLARRLAAYSVRRRVLPKRLEPRLVMLRDPKVRELGAASLEELKAHIRDRNYRIFAERDGIHVLNNAIHLSGQDPFDLFAKLSAADSALDVAHAFYLGYELAKAVTALTLNKNYAQDRALDWGLLTRPERADDPEKAPDAKDDPPPSAH